MYACYILFILLFVLVMTMTIAQHHLSAIQIVVHIDVLYLIVTRNFRRILISDSFL